VVNDISTEETEAVSIEISERGRIVKLHYFHKEVMKSECEGANNSKYIVVVSDDNFPWGSIKGESPVVA
jgi:hypothetical protein